jgi:hypothetical protein
LAHHFAHHDFAFLLSGWAPRVPALNRKIMVGKMMGQT